jgi:AraC family transcriptional regulator, arabinose operon regulatory protein
MFRFARPFVSSVKSSQLQSPVPTTDRRMQQAIELIGLKPAIQIWDIANSLNLSASRFRHLFTAELGMSPRQYLRRARLECARELLEASSLSVKEVTAMVGFNDVSHFARDYKTTYGQTPRQTRLTGKSSTATASTANK